jgi:hypothetical protein
MREQEMEIGNKRHTEAGAGCTRGAPRRATRLPRVAARGGPRYKEMLEHLKYGRNSETYAGWGVIQSFRDC